MSLQKLKCFFGFHKYKVDFTSFDDFSMAYICKSCVHCGKSTEGVIV